MKGFDRDKIQRVFWPVLRVVLGGIAGYIGLYALIFHVLVLAEPRDDFYMFMAPAAYALIVLLIWARPKLNLLHLERAKGRDLDGLFYVVLTAAIAVPAGAGQMFVRDSSQTIEHLPRIEQAGKQDMAQAYTVDRYHAALGQPGFAVDAEATGKNNRDLRFSVYAAIPLVDDSADTRKTQVFLAKRFSKTIPNRGSDEEKEAAYQKFIQDTQAEYDRYRVEPFQYLARMGAGSTRDQFQKAAATSERYAGNALILEPEYVPFEERVGSTPMVFGISLVAGVALWFLMILLVRMKDASDESVVPDYLQPKPDEPKGWRAWLQPGFLATPILIGLNVLVFLAMVLTGQGFMDFPGEVLLVWGANHGPETLNGAWWRLLTSTFLHGGFIHLFGNMYALFVVSPLLEPVMGTKKYTMIYLISGIVASLASVFWNPNVISVGASGAIFGMYGLSVALIARKVYPTEFGKQFLKNNAIFIALNLGYGFTGANIDNAAHIGGLVCGFLLGFLVKPEGYMRMVETNEGEQ